MTTELKPTVDKASTFDLLDNRLGRVIEVAPEPEATKPSFRVVVDFGKFGRRTSVARLTQHQSSELLGKQVLGVMNFPPREIGGAISEVLILGVQYPKADSGEATFVTPAVEAKLGSKLF